MGGGHGFGGGYHGGGYHGGGSWRGGYRGGGSWGGAYHGSGYWQGYRGHYPYYRGYYPYYRYPRGFYGYGGYGYPWVSFGWYGGAWSDAYYSYPEQPSPVYVYTPPDTSGSYVDYEQQQQINRLNDEVDRLSAARAVPQSSVPQPPKPEIRAGTVLVFRDNHSEEIENYAIVGKTLWVFTEQRARKIPIAELNLAATTKANEARGIDFRLPTP